MAEKELTKRLTKLLDGTEKIVKDVDKMVQMFEQDTRRLREALAALRSMGKEGDDDR